MVFPQVGVQALMETQNFEKGMSIYNDGLSAMVTKSMAMGTVIGQAFSQLGQKILGFASNLNVAKSTLDEWTGTLMDALPQGLAFAARAEELDMALKVLGSRAGYSSQELDTLVMSIVKLGIQTDVAQKTMQQFIRYNLDLAKSTELARVAQDTAILSGQNSSDTLDRMIWGIQTYNTEIFRTIGLNVNMQLAFSEMAAELGKSTDALTADERMQAALNAVLKEGARNAGLYEAAMQSAGKQLASFKRDTYELAKAMGTPLLPAMLTIVEASRSIVQEWTKALTAGEMLQRDASDLTTYLGENAQAAAGTYQEYGKLYMIMMKVSAGFSLLADAVVAMAKKGSTAIINFISTNSDRFETWIWNAAQWGLNLMVAFANGIMQGASTVLIAAMRFISNILSRWLLGASPPLVAPELPQWGMKAMEKWLSGFKDADFSALQAIQGPLMQALQMLVQTGNMAEEAMGSTYASISAAIAKALSTGVVDESIYDKLIAAGGMFGTELANLARAQINLALATREATKAQEEYDDAMERASKAGEKVSEKTREYNDLLRSGASKEVLQAKLNEINASRKEQDLAINDAKLAQDKFEAAQKNIEQLQKLADLQSQILAQLLAITQAQIVQPKGGGGGGGGGGLPPIDLGGLGGGGFDTTVIDELLAKLKKDLAEKFSTLWSDAMDLIDWSPWQRFQITLEQKLGEISTAFEESGISEFFSKIFTPEVQEDIANTTGKIIGFALALGLLALIIGLIFSPLGAFIIIIGLLGILLAGLSEKFGGLDEAFKYFKANLRLWWIGISNQIDESDAKTELWKTEQQRRWDEWSSGILETVDAWAIDMTAKFVAWWTDVKDYWALKGMELSEAWSGLWTALKAEVSKLWNDPEGIVQTIMKAIEEVKLLFTDPTSGFNKLFQDVKTNVLDPLEKGFNNVKAAISGVVTWVGNLIKAVLGGDWAKVLELLKAWLPGSPVPLAYGMDQVADAMERLSNTTIPDLNNAMLNSQMPNMASMPANINTSNRTLNVTQQNNINGNLDMALMESRFRMIIRQEFGTA